MIPVQSENLTTKKIIIKTNLEGDWVVVEDENYTLFRGHSLGIPHVIDLLRLLGHEVEHIEDFDFENN